MRVVRVVDNHGTTKTVTVLRGQVAVVPEGTSLIGCGEVIQERVSRGDGALVHESRAVGPVGALLEEAVPMLQRMIIS